jgi:peptidyl-prolyl cis-trans isomerase C
MKTDPKETLMKLQWKILTAPVICLSLGLAPLAMAAQNDVVATVNGETIQQKDVDGYIRDFNLSPEQAKRHDLIINELVSRELVYQDALKKKLDKRADVVAELEQVRVKILLNAAVREAMQANPITEDEMKKEYQAQLPKMQQQEFKARHILVKTEDEGKAIVTALERGADFSTLANEKSLDSSAKDGGDLGWFPAGQMVAPFAAAVADMKKGGYSKAPVQTQFGWHVIALDDTRQGKAPDYETIKPQLQNFLQQRHIAAYLDKLRSGAKIDVKAP